MYWLRATVSLELGRELKELKGSFVVWQFMEGALGSISKRKTGKHFNQNRETGIKIAQNRKTAENNAPKR